MNVDVNVIRKNPFRDEGTIRLRRIVICQGRPLIEYDALALTRLFPIGRPGRYLECWSKWRHIWSGLKGAAFGFVFVNLQIF